MTTSTSTNLWEILVLHFAHYKDEKDELLINLGSSASMSGQEISLIANLGNEDEKGWTVCIFSCYESGNVKIFIPSNRNSPVKIIEDTRKDSEYFDK